MASLFQHGHKKHKDRNSKHINKIVDNRSLYNKDESVGPPIPVDHWVDDHIMLCVNTRYSDYIHTSFDKQVAIPMNCVFPFESKLFKGKAIMRCVNLPSTDKAYFKGRARKMDITFQGQFKRRLCFDRLYTGQIFDKPFINLPGQMLISGAIKIVKALAPAVMANIYSDTPHMMSPLASAAQVINVCKPGQERELPLEPKECLDLVHSDFVGMKFTDRKSYFNDLNHLSKFDYEPGLVYTFSCYSHMVAPSSYSIHMMGMKWGIHTYLTSPFQSMQVVLPPRNKGKSLKDIDDDDDSSNSNDTTDTALDEEQNIEIMASEALESESKEEEEVEHSHSKSYSKSSGKSRDGSNSEFDDLNDCEFLLNLQVWHQKLVEELYPNDKQKGQRKSSSGVKGLFGF